MGVEVTPGSRLLRVWLDSASPLLREQRVHNLRRNVLRRP